MKSIGLWLLLAVVLLVIATEVDARKGKKPKNIKIKIVIKYKKKPRGRRSIEDTLSLPCDVREYDKDQDGIIGKNEWESFISEYNPTLNSAEYMDLVIQQLDANRDRVLQIEEFVSDTEYKKDCL
ncbi:uncharacterized protein LOC132558381 [Ylistrum balloti]|uniref:uncharacterized protein LOC132558381 n=1 Tax=Ylistrum balloti TaxID=509963 RepID=UPI002905F5B0|nr:uncharacterized protein LOC132558381 [Ylistrum balloti]